VVDVSAKLAARVRVFDTGNARKTDSVDAHAATMVAVRTPGLRSLSYDEELIALRLLADRRDELAKHRVQTLNRLHRLLTQLIPARPSVTCRRCRPRSCWRRYVPEPCWARRYGALLLRRSSTWSPSRPSSRP
jgi:hypothetical protein